MSTVTLLLTSNLEVFNLYIDTSYKHLFNYSRFIKSIINPTRIYSVASRHKRRYTLTLGTTLTGFAIAITANISIFYSLNCKGLQVYIKPALIVYIVYRYCI